jgi:hypothetical protein
MISTAVTAAVTGTYFPFETVRYLFCGGGTADFV